MGKNEKLKEVSVVKSERKNNKDKKNDKRESEYRTVCTK